MKFSLEFNRPDDSSIRRIIQIDRIEEDSLFIAEEQGFGGSVPLVEVSISSDGALAFTSAATGLVLLRVGLDGSITFDRSAPRAVAPAS